MSCSSCFLVSKFIGLQWKRCSSTLLCLLCTCIWIMRVGSCICTNGRPEFGRCCVRLSVKWSALWAMRTRGYMRLLGLRRTLRRAARALLHTGTRECRLVFVVVYALGQASDSFGRFLRFWRMLELLASRKYGARCAHACPVYGRPYGMRKRVCVM